MEPPVQHTLSYADLNMLYFDVLEKCTFMASERLIRLLQHPSCIAAYMFPNMT